MCTFAITANQPSAVGHYPNDGGVEWSSHGTERLCSSPSKRYQLEYFFFIDDD